MIDGTLGNGVDQNSVLTTASARTRPALMLSVAAPTPTR